MKVNETKATFQHLTAHSIRLASDGSLEILRDGVWSSYVQPEGEGHQDVVTHRDDLGSDKLPSIQVLGQFGNGTEEVNREAGDGVVHRGDDLAGGHAESDQAVFGCHCSSSCCGEGAATPDDPSVGGGGRPGVGFSSPASGTMPVLVQVGDFWLNPTHVTIVAVEDDGQSCTVMTRGQKKVSLPGITADEAAALLNGCEVRS